MPKTRTIIAEIIFIIFGIYLVLDAIIFKAITFNYDKFGISWLDPYFSHAYIGLILIIIGIIGIGVKKVLGYVKI